MTSPGHDQDGARLRDLQRLRALLRPYPAGPAGRISGALAWMTPDDRSEARAILARLGGIGEDPHITAARQDTLPRLAEMETTLRDVLARPHYLIRDGEAVTDPRAGKPVPGHAIGRQARAQLRALQRLRTRLTGQPPGDDDGPGAGGGMMGAGS